MQKRYEGSDRQARGFVLRELRASDVPVTHAELERAVTDAARRARALTGLVADGLIVPVEGGFALP